MEIYENTALMWLERTRRAELVDLEVEKENSLEEKNLEMEEESNVEMEEVKKHTNEVSNKPDHLRMVGEDIEVEIGEGLHKKSDDKRLVSEGLNNEQNETMHYWLRPIRRGQFRFANFVSHLRGKCHFHFLIH